MKYELYPLLFQPVLKDYIWGGRNLAEKVKRPLPEGKNIAESWEIAAHPDGDTEVINGRYAGKTLSALTLELGLDLIGTNNSWALERGKFPLLIKLLDANDKLSVQVHPDDAYALANEGNELGKTEMWVVLYAEPDAKIILGVKPGTTPESFRQAIEEGTLERHLHEIPVKVGDAICVPAGSLHAILSGLVIAEIQQNSNTTYRVYDWNRKKNGVARPLHIQQAMEVINFQQTAPTLPAPKIIETTADLHREILCQNRYFVTERVQMGENAAFSGECNGRTLEIWGVLDGEVTVNGMQITAVQFTLLPAKMGSYTIQAQKPATLLRTYVANQ
jgi:mannose-6-phosphate isomerase